MAISDLFPQWLGGTSGAAGAQDYSDIAAAMNPALSGQATMASVAPSYSNQVASSINPNWTVPGSSSSGAQPASQGLSEALQKLGQSYQQQNKQNQGPTQPGLQLASGEQRSAGFSPGSNASLASLVQLLMNRGDWRAPTYASTGAYRGLLGI